MADLNELSQFEKDLHNLISNPTSFMKKVPENIDTSIMSPTLEQQLNNAKQKNLYLRPIKSDVDNTQNNHYTLDDILKCADEINDNARTLMVVPEHGQPYNKYKYVTRMAIREHGQRYKYNEK